jgi:hypothetical protein
VRTGQLYCPKTQGDKEVIYTNLRYFFFRFFLRDFFSCLRLFFSFFTTLLDFGTGAKKSSDSGEKPNFARLFVDRIQRRNLLFEKKFGMSTDEFKRRFTADDLGETLDFRSIRLICWKKKEDGPGARIK